MNLTSSVDRKKIFEARILVVDDSEMNARLLERVLTGAGFSHVTTTTDPQAVIPMFLEHAPDLLLLDLHMPLLGGFGVMSELQSLIPADSYFPILVVTGDETADAKQRALQVGGKDFLTKPFDPTEIVLRVKNLLQTRFLHMELQVQNVVLEARVRERTAALQGAVGGLERSLTELRLSREETVRRLATVAELRGVETGEHVRRLSHYCALLAERMGQLPERCELLRLASQMHDLGNIALPDAILLKEGTLDQRERAEMQTHANIGYEILSDSQSELLKLGATIARSHHERVDGSGYPQGLVGEAIPLEARITAVADVFDALTSDRVYRKAFPLPDALEIMERGRGTHFDPNILDVFLSSLDDILTFVGVRTPA